MKRKLISITLSIMILASIWWGYGQWRLLGSLTQDKGNQLKLQYDNYSMYLATLEELTAKLMLTGDSPGHYSDEIRWLRDNLNNISSFDTCGFSRIPLNHRNLREFCRAAHTSLTELASKEELAPQALNYIKQVNEKARELNRINNKYKYRALALDNKKFLRSNLWVNAVNEMDASFTGYAYQTYFYTQEDTKPHTNNWPPPEEVYGSKIYSEAEILEVARDFLRGMDTISATYSSGGGSRAYGNSAGLDYLNFTGDKGYQIDVYTLGGKVSAMYHSSNWNIHKNKPYSVPAINITKEKAISKLVDFLEEREIGPLSVGDTRTTDRQLMVSLSAVEEDYLNDAASVSATLDLTKEGMIIALRLDDYWEGLSFDNSQKDTALDARNKARSALKPGIPVKEEMLVGRWSSDFSLAFSWRFTAEYAGEDYYIFVDPFTGTETDIRKVHR